MSHRLFIGCFPAGLVFADKQREKGGDYARCAFLAFNTLDLKIEPDCPPSLKAEIKAQAAEIQAKRGQPFRVSTCGQTVILGE